MPVCGLCLQYCPFTHTFSLFPSATPLGPPKPSSGPPAPAHTHTPPHPIAKPPWFLLSALSSSSPRLSGLDSLQAKHGSEIVNPAFLGSFHQFGILYFCGYWVAVQSTRSSLGLRETWNQQSSLIYPWLLAPGSGKPYLLKAELSLGRFSPWQAIQRTHPSRPWQDFAEQRTGYLSSRDQADAGREWPCSPLPERGNVYFWVGILATASPKARRAFAFHSCKNSTTSSCPHCRNEKMETGRSEVVCPRSHREHAFQPELRHWSLTLSPVFFLRDSGRNFEEK